MGKHSELVDMVLKEFKVDYSILLGRKGRINYRHKRIDINPQFNEDLITLAHEVSHYIADSFGIAMSESEIEKNAYRLVQDSEIHDCLAYHIQGLKNGG